MNSPSSPRSERRSTKKKKKMMIETLWKAPIIELACNKVGISRSTHYEWVKNDYDYRVKIEKAMEQGVKSINDLANMGLIGGIKKGEHRSIAFWLKHHDPDYMDKPTSPLPMEQPAQDKPLPLEQQQLIEQAIRFALPKDKSNSTL